MDELPVISKIITELESLPSCTLDLPHDIDLKKIQTIIDVLSFRVNKKVSQFICYKNAYDNNKIVFEICPECGSVLERTYQAYCAHCGQKLKWIKHKDMTEKL